jgi:hypothetical protein
MRRDYPGDTDTDGNSVKADELNVAEWTQEKQRCLKDNSGSCVGIKCYLRSHVFENKRKGVNNESNCSFKGRPSHMEQEQNHYIKVGNKSLKM